MKIKIEYLRSQFERISERSRFLVERTREDRLYWRPRAISNSLFPFSFGEYILRSTAMVEQAFGGITTRLWDDPFEWTLPEKLTTKESVLFYLAEVYETSNRGFDFLKNDTDLDMHIPAPTELRPIFAILVDAIGKAEHFQGRAFSIFQLFSDEKLPRV